ncbi:unnamed protein product [Pylaiella littoralis]
MFDENSEHRLALRMCPNPLEISAAVRKEKVHKKLDPEARLYQLAARNLREHHGVPSMSPVKLIKTLTFLKLNPRRLVKQGKTVLALKTVLSRTNPAEATQKESKRRGKLLPTAKKTATITSTSRKLSPPARS